MLVCAEKKRNCNNTSASVAIVVRMRYIISEGSKNQSVMQACAFVSNFCEKCTSKRNWCSNTRTLHAAYLRSTSGLVACKLRCAGWVLSERLCRKSTTPNCEWASSALRRKRSAIFDISEKRILYLFLKDQQKKTPLSAAPTTLLDLISNTKWPPPAAIFKQENMACSLKNLTRCILMYQ